MGARIGAALYDAAWRAAGRLTAPPHPRPYLLTRGVSLVLPGQANDVYNACADRIVRYVGSTTRGVAIRLREHLRVHGRAAWEELWVIALIEDASPYGVLLAEERVGRLLEPT